LAPLGVTQPEAFTTFQASIQPGDTEENCTSSTSVTDLIPHIAILSVSGNLDDLESPLIDADEIKNGVIFIFNLMKKNDVTSLVSWFQDKTSEHYHAVRAIVLGSLVFAPDNNSGVPIAPSLTVIMALSPQLVRLFFYMSPSFP